MWHHQPAKCTANSHQVRCIASVLATVRLCSVRRPECAQRHAHDAADGEEPRSRPRCWQSSVSISPHFTNASYSLKYNSPEQLILQDDPSFLPEFAAPPLELLDLDLGFDFSINRTGDSQSLTPFGSQSSSHAGPLGGLILPTSSPGQPGSFPFAGDTDNDNVGASGMLGADEGYQINEPDFTFDENGELVEDLQARAVAGTPAARSAAAMQSDAGASAKVRREHEEGRAGGVQVSFTAVLRAFGTLYSLVCLASGLGFVLFGLTHHLTWES
jgi:hypothetical protein